MSELLSLPPWLLLVFFVWTTFLVLLLVRFLSRNGFSSKWFSFGKSDLSTDVRRLSGQVLCMKCQLSSMRYNSEFVVSLDRLYQDSRPRFVAFLQSSCVFYGEYLGAILLDTIRSRIRQNGLHDVLSKSSIKGYANSIVSSLQSDFVLYQMVNPSGCSAVVDWSVVLDGLSPVVLSVCRDVCSLYRTCLNRTLVDIEFYIAELSSSVDSASLSDVNSIVNDLRSKLSTLDT